MGAVTTIPPPGPTKGPTEAPTEGAPESAPDLRGDTGGAAVALRAASQRLVRTVDALGEEDWGGPSLLPGWTRGHVVAHLALNAEGLAGAVRGVVAGPAAPMYASPEARDADIATLGEADPTVLRERLLGAVTDLADALVALVAQPPALLDATIERTPGAPRTFRAGAVAWMRLREVEIHHVDLARDYSPGAWPTPFTLALLDDLAGRRATNPAVDLVARDLDRRWRIGEGGPTVSGPAAGLAWWLTGRPPYPGLDLTSEGGALPELEGM